MVNRRMEPERFSPSVGRHAAALQSQLLPWSFCLSVSGHVAPSAAPAVSAGNPLPWQRDVEAQIYSCRRSVSRWWPVRACPAPGDISCMSIQLSRRCREHYYYIWVTASPAVG